MGRTYLVPQRVQGKGTVPFVVGVGEGVSPPLLVDHAMRMGEKQGVCQGRRDPNAVGEFFIIKVQLPPCGHSHFSHPSRSSILKDILSAAPSQLQIVERGSVIKQYQR